MNAEKAALIRALNDRLRHTRAGGRIMLTRGVVSLGPQAVLQALKTISEFEGFDADNDPYGEHDFGAVSLSGARLFWKIDYYDRSLQWGAADPADADSCVRVMTVMLASEY